MPCLQIKEKYRKLQDCVVSSYNFIFVDVDKVSPKIFRESAIALLLDKVSSSLLEKRIWIKRRRFYKS